MKVEISIGEAVDKVTILEIKLEKVTDSGKLKNIKKEYQLLKDAINEVGILSTSDEYNELRNVNSKLWHIEDEIRIKEFNKEFDEKFIELARSVYWKNDTRSDIKRKINLKFGSELIEEKNYTNYKKV